MSGLSPPPQNDAPSSGGPVRRGYAEGLHGQVHYRISQPVQNTRPTLVLLHQNPSSSLEYAHLIAEIGRDRRVIALDTPGYGMSDRPPAPLSMAGYAASLFPALETLVDEGDGPVDLYGFHTGTLLAIEMALAHPHRIGRLILSGIPMHPAAERAKRLNDAVGMAKVDESGDVMLDLARRLWDYVVGQRDRGMTLDDAAEMWIEKLKPLDKTAWAYEGVWSYDYEGRLPLLTHSVLVLQPDETIAQQSLSAAAIIPHAQVERLAGMDRDIFHAPQSLAPLAAAMRRYLDTDVPSGV